MKQIIFTAVLILSFSFGTFALVKDTSFNAPERIAIIHSDFLFEEKSRIKVLAEAYQKINDKLKAEETQLDVLLLITQNLKKQLENLQNSSTLFRYKLDELLSTQREYNFRAEKKSSLPKKHKLELINTFKVREALMQFMKQNGFEAILDKSEILDHAIIIEGNQRFPYVTPAFIQFYNDNYSKTYSQ